jgi:hypothetical protein
MLSAENVVGGIKAAQNAKAAARNADGGETVVGHAGILRPVEELRRRMAARGLGRQAGLQQVRNFVQECFEYEYEQRFGKDNLCDANRIAGQLQI